MEGQGTAVAVQRVYSAKDSSHLSAKYADTVNAFACDGGAVLSFYETLMPFPDDDVSKVDCQLVARLMLTWPQLERTAALINGLLAEHSKGSLE